MWFFWQQANHLDFAVLCWHEQREPVFCAHLLGHHKVHVDAHLQQLPHARLLADKRCLVQLVAQPLQHLGSLTRLGLPLRLLLLNQQTLRFVVGAVLLEATHVTVASVVASAASLRRRGLAAVVARVDDAANLEGLPLHRPALALAPSLLPLSSPFPAPSPSPPAAPGSWLAMVSASVAVILADPSPLLFTAPTLLSPLRRVLALSAGGFRSAASWASFLAPPFATCRL